MSLKVHLVIIDPQNDFCDPVKGTLYVKGADEDMKRISKTVRRIASKLEDIHITLDSHHSIDVAHPSFWLDSKGDHPKPFTIITSAEVESGRWKTFRPGLHTRMLKYIKDLEGLGRYPLCIWPEHCLIGSTGAAIDSELFAALKEYTKLGATINFVTKGSNIYTEHYSAVQAEVPDPKDPSTMLNSRFIKTLMEADMVAFAGEAGSHCLANTVRDVVKNFNDDSLVKKMVLLKGCYSPVPGFEKLQDNFVSDMVAKGMQVVECDDFLA